ncbi:hypothetical protein QAD02_004983 [Eretmocerus hayati]|uniref:Uncharacterized protein n=1 Tax=Eretmocerus hayati TaxID=131215 RepID=A0ACC2NSZ9_9HYME|nr:hypothetical protein QAD02_004983 [Eretmocerus hayati]
MLGKIATLTTLRNLTGLSRTLVRQSNLSNARCFGSKLAEPICTRRLSNLSKPITFKSAIQPTPVQLTKIIGNNFIQRRCQSSHGDHVNLWKLERVVASAFLPLLPLCFMLENPILDSLLAILSVIHVHWGLEAIIVDYARPIVVGPIFPKVCFALLYLTSALTLGGLLVLIFNGPGLTTVIKHGWAIGKDK